MKREGAMRSVSRLLLRSKMRGVTRRGFVVEFMRVGDGQSAARRWKTLSRMTLTSISRTIFRKAADIHDFVKIMGNKVGRVALFEVPLQQQWSYENSGDSAPTYYLQTDSPLYYYSFTDAYIAMAYRSLSKEEQARFEPMITGFNPTDMYAADHIRRVLQTFPGVFSGIGEFSIHKEFVSAKIAGETADLQNRALDRVLDFAAEVGLVVILHNDMDVPFPKQGAPPAYLEQMKASS